MWLPVGTAMASGDLGVYGLNSNSQIEAFQGGFISSSLILFLFCCSDAAALYWAWLGCISHHFIAVSADECKKKRWPLSESGSFFLLQSVCSFYNFFSFFYPCRCSIPYLSYVMVVLYVWDIFSCCLQSSCSVYKFMIRLPYLYCLMFNDISRFGKFDLK